MKGSQKVTWVLKLTGKEVFWIDARENEEVSIDSIALRRRWRYPGRTWCSWTFLRRKAKDQMKRRMKVVEIVKKRARYKGREISSEMKNTLFWEYMSNWVRRAQEFHKFEQIS